MSAASRVSRRGDVDFYMEPGVDSACKLLHSLFLQSVALKINSWESRLAEKRRPKAKITPMDLTSCAQEVWDDIHRARKNWKKTVKSHSVIQHEEEQGEEQEEEEESRPKRRRRPNRVH